mmetsp:Transcript_33747/g.97336  ORF Transcript_33747/g.97336 Transcript_33747/m.97336 type:complete len:207 (-) Transcript_33747:1269-1889(-)
MQRISSRPRFRHEGVSEYPAAAAVRPASPRGSDGRQGSGHHMGIPPPHRRAHRQAQPVHHGRAAAAVRAGQGVHGRHAARPGHAQGVPGHGCRHGQGRHEEQERECVLHIRPYTHWGYVVPIRIRYARHQRVLRPHPPGALVGPGAARHHLGARQAARGPRRLRPPQRRSHGQAAGPLPGPSLSETRHYTLPCPASGYSSPSPQAP